MYTVYIYLNDNVNSQLSPREFERIPIGDNLDELPVDADRLVVDCLDVGLERSQHRVVLEQVRSLAMQRTIKSHH